LTLRATVLAPVPFLILVSTSTAVPPSGATWNVIVPSLFV
jgi:hypothetical protein